MTQRNKKKNKKADKNNHKNHPDKPFRLSKHQRRRVEADFSGGRLTSDAGLLLLRELDKRMSLSQAFSDCLPDPRDPDLITHKQQTMITQRICAIAAGYEDVNDHQTLRNDPALQMAAQVEPDEDNPLASPSTLCRLEQRATRQAIVDMHEVLVDQFIDAHKSAPKHIVLDFDATDDPIHGNQEARFFNGYYKHYCYLPLYVFCGEHLLCAYLRPSDIGADKHARGILKLLVDKIRQSWPDTKIIFRGDCGFGRWKIMRWCDRHQVKYIVGIGKNDVLLRLSREVRLKAAWQTRETKEKTRLFDSINYGAKTWDRKRRIVVKAEHQHCNKHKDGANTRFVATNLELEEVIELLEEQGEDVQQYKDKLQEAKDSGVELTDAQKLQLLAELCYDKVYCPRGDMENRIKEQQLDLFADRTSCSNMLPNQLRLLLSSFAYVLMQALRKSLEGTELAKAQCSTLRVKLIKIAAQVTVSARRVWFRLSSSYPYHKIFEGLARKLVPT